jgi:hypothetical protein
LIFVFDNYVLDTGRCEFRCGHTLVSVQPQVFDLLEYLMRNRGHVVSRDDLLDAIWGGRIVSESTLATRINAARSAIGDDGESQRLIRTLSFDVCSGTKNENPPFLDLDRLSPGANLLLHKTGMRAPGNHVSFSGAGTL